MERQEEVIGDAGQVEMEQLKGKWEEWEEEPYFTKLEEWNVRHKGDRKKTFLKFLGF